MLLLFFFYYATSSSLSFDFQTTNLHYNHAATLQMGIEQKDINDITFSHDTHYLMGGAELLQ